MLVIANGCGWCGSTWLASILLEVVEPKPLPTGFHDERLDNMPTIKRGMLRKFLDEVDYASESYVAKNNFYYERSLLERYENVHVVDIERDSADMLVSLFFHSSPAKMAGATVEQVRQAYWHVGPVVVEHVARHHAIWGGPCSWVYRSSYERLKAAPEAEIAAIASFLGIALPPARIAAIIQATTLGRLSEKWAKTPSLARRFRNGRVGDHRNYFDAPIVSHIRQIESDNAGYPRNAEQQQEYALEREQYCDRACQWPYERDLARQARMLELS